MKNFRYTSVMLLAAITLLGGCKKDELEDAFDNGACPIVDPCDTSVLFATQEALTRGTPVNDDADLTDMGVCYVSTGGSDWSAIVAYPAADKKYWKMNKAKGSNRWTYDGAPVYWAAGKQSFFAYTPYETPDNGIFIFKDGIGTPVVYYLTPTDVTRQPDLMVAVPRYDMQHSRKPVKLEMKHALTCVGFQVKGNGEKITGISIEGVAVSGRMAMDGSNIAWATKATPTYINSVELNCDPGQNYYTCTPGMSTNLIAGNGYLMMIPQTLDSAKAKVIITLSDGKTKKIDLSTQTWTPGKRVTYTIDMRNLSISGKKTYGWGSDLNEQGYIMQPGSGTRKIVDAAVNFGTDAASTVKIERYSAASTFNHSTLYSWPVDVNNVRKMFATKPDIVLTGYTLATTDRNVTNQVMDYLTAGGVLVMASENTDFARTLFETMYPGTTITAIFYDWYYVERISDVVKDEITDGPFGNIGGAYWGYDWGGGIRIKGLPEDDIVVYARHPDGSPTMFRHKRYNLFFIGDGGAFANTNGKSGGLGGRGGWGDEISPLAFNNDFTPATRIKYDDPGNSVENGRLFANVMAWAVKQAETNGIN